MERVLDLRLPDEQERVLVRMARCANDDGTNCYPGVKLLADETGRSERSVQRVLRALEGAGLVVPVANMIGGRGRVAGYHVTLTEPVKGDTHDTLSPPETATPATPIEPERVSPATPFDRERVTSVTPFSEERATPTTPFTPERVSPVTVKGVTGDTSPSPPITPLSPSGKDPEEIATPSELSTTPVGTGDQAKILRGLSAEAREILDWHRQCHGRRHPAKLTPESARVLEAAVADFGVERLREAVKYMAGLIPPVPELSKALRAAATKRQKDEAGPAAARNGTHRSAPASQPPAGSIAARVPVERFTS